MKKLDFVFVVAWCAFWAGMVVNDVDNYMPARAANSETWGWKTVFMVMSVILVSVGLGYNWGKSE